MLLLAALFFFFALILFWLASRQRKSLGMPGGRVIYADTSHWNRLEQPLTDAELGLTGKPDYLVEQGGSLIPVEVKSTRIGQAPYDSHIYQLAAYCLLVERVLGVRPPYGILHYPNRTFALDYTSELENAVLRQLWEMQEATRKELPRSHQSSQRCARCGFRLACDQALRI